MMILSAFSWLVEIAGRGMTRPLVISTGSPSPVISRVCSWLKLSMKSLSFCNSSHIMLISCFFFFFFFVFCHSEDHFLCGKDSCCGKMIYHTSASWRSSGSLNAVLFVSVKCKEYIGLCDIWLLNVVLYCARCWPWWDPQIGTSINDYYIYILLSSPGWQQLCCVGFQHRCGWCCL